MLAGSIQRRFMRCLLDPFTTQWNGCSVLHREDSIFDFALGLTRLRCNDVDPLVIDVLVSGKHLSCVLLWILFVEGRSFAVEW